MAFEFAPREDEVVEEDIDLRISDRSQLRIVLTNHGAYWPRRKLIAVADDVETVFVPLARIWRIVLRRKSQIGSLAVGLLMCAAGVVWTLAGTAGLPQALIVGGIALAVVGSRRLVFLVEATDTALRWTSPVTFGRAGRLEIETTARQLAGWAERHSIRLEASSRLYSTNGSAPVATRYPLASAPSSSESPAVPCRNCGGGLSVSRWDHFNGCLVVCPHCGRLHGKPWSIAAVMLSGLFLNALSFFLVMRPRRAFSFLLLFAGWFALLAFYVEPTRLSDWSAAAAFLTAFFGPVLINTVFLVRHRMNLGRLASFP